MAQLARFSPAAVVQRITRGGDVAEPAHTIDEIVEEATRHRSSLNETADPARLRDGGGRPRGPAAQLRRAVRHASDRGDLLPRDAADGRGDPGGGAPPRRPRGHRLHARRHREELRPRGDAARRRRHEALEVRQRPDDGGAAGREHPKDVHGHGRGRAGRDHQARRPAAQHAHARAPAAGEAGAHRAPDDGDLRAARASARHVADQVGARGPRVQVPRAGEVPPAGRDARRSPKGARGVRQQEHRHPAQGAREGRHHAPRSAGDRSTSTRSRRRWSARVPSSPRSTT